ncbi:glycoside hydrolase family 26 protein [Catellatospora bangladeshensis]|uniref:GH26 domain-containing protein n=1 Tax=Catellatospora bangladeshensis TaxID=310355 RepID=A0A8J3JEL4_9ACTN|nr:glycosyl hydrolase [Catellatospora bangladeshensis]GIF79231.1 hypothetical protein Cba03nite_05800 [Catellatospora bangladeshensis]
MPVGRGGAAGRLLRILSGVAAVALLATCGSPPRADRGIAVAPSGPAGTRPPLASGGPVAAPPSGALLGAWVRPASLTQAGRVTGVLDFERDLGRRLDIVHTYRRLREEFGTSSDRTFLKSGATLMFSWTGGPSAEVLLGEHDELIRERARQSRDLGTPVLLRLRWEMDRPNLLAEVGSPDEYVAAWRHTRELFAAEGADNVSWVWCPTEQGFATGRAQDFYPGDDQVDWTCADVYAGSTLTPIADLLEPFLHWAAARPHPIMIGEYGVSRAWTAPQRADWLSAAHHVFRTNTQIKAVLYFESNPDNRTPAGEFALRPDPTPFAAFHTTAHDPWFNPHPEPR